jgi:hypothetical protein
MKPRGRRLLIPGLLVALLVVVVIAAAERKSGAQESPAPIVPMTRVSVIDDPRITESSGLAASTKHPGIAYTINDSGHSAQVFAVRISTGEVVGVTSVRGAKWGDAEALALAGGKLWIADTGDNARSRDDSALYAMDEPGPGDHQVDAVRYPIGFGPHHLNVEAIAVGRGRVALYDKAWPSGAEFVARLPLIADRPNIARPSGRVAPMYVTDAAATPDGRYVLLRNIVMVEVHDSRTWKVVHVDAIRPNATGESLALEASGRSYLIGSEGENSELNRVAFDRSSFGARVDVLDAKEQWEQSRAYRPRELFFMDHLNLIVAGGLLAAVAAVALTWRVIRRRRRQGAEGGLAP